MKHQLLWVFGITVIVSILFQLYSGYKPTWQDILYLSVVWVFLWMVIGSMLDTIKQHQLKVDVNEIHNLFDEDPVLKAELQKMDELTSTFIKNFKTQFSYLYYQHHGTDPTPEQIKFAFETFTENWRSKR